MLLRSLRSVGIQIIVGLAVVSACISPSFAQRRPAAPTKAASGQRTAKPPAGAKPPASSKAPVPAPTRAKTAAPAKSAGDTKPLDLRYITADFSLAVVVHPQDILALPQVRALPVEFAEAAALERLGIELGKLREITVLLAIDAKGESQPAVIARFTEAVDQASIEAKVRQLFQRDGPEAPMAIVPEPNTVLVGRRPLLEKMFRTKGEADSPLLKMLRQLDSRGTATAAAIVGPLREELRAAVTQLPLLPPALAEVAALPELVNSIQLSVMVAPDQCESWVNVECRDEVSAARLNAIVDRAVRFSNQTLEAQLAEMQSRGAPATEQAPLLYTLRIQKSIAAAVERKQIGNSVDIRGSGELGSAPALAAVAAGLMLPAVPSARQAARRTQATNNLKMIGLGFHNYHDVYGRLPTSTYDKDGKPLLSWRVHILPFIEGEALYQQFHLDEPWDSDHNKKLIARMPAVYRSPNFIDAERTIYLAAAGPQALFPEGKAGEGDNQAGAALAGAGAAGVGNAGAIGQVVAFRKDNVDLAWARKISFLNITDGTSNTIMVVEGDPDAAVIWTKPDDLSFDAEKPLAGLGTLNKTGFQALFCDGSVHFIPTTIEAEVLRRLFNPQDGMQIPPGAF